VSIERGTHGVMGPGATGLDELRVRHREKRVDSRKRRRVAARLRIRGPKRGAVEDAGRKTVGGAHAQRGDYGRFFSFDGCGLGRPWRVGRGWRLGRLDGARVWSGMLVGLRAAVGAGAVWPDCTGAPKRSGSLGGRSAWPLGAGTGSSVEGRHPGRERSRTDRTRRLNRALAPRRPERNRPRTCRPKGPAEARDRGRGGAGVK